MRQDMEYQHLMQSIGKKSFELLQEQVKEPQLPQLIDQYISLIKDYQLVTGELFKNPETMTKTQTNYALEYFQLFQNQCMAWMDGKSLNLEDKRFQSAEWINNPWFNMLGQQYLLLTKHMLSLLENIKYEDEHVAKRMQFFVKQHLDALSPSNFFSTNPEIIAETIQSHGKNVLKGLDNLLRDLEEGNGQLNISMVKKDAFSVGKNLATTKGSVIFRNDMMELIQYAPQTKTVHEIPLLVIPPWINKYYILDLSENNSLIGWLVSKGFTVFVISWVNPTNRSYAHKTLFNYLHEGPHTAIETIKAQLGVFQVNTLGFCIGGTLQTMLLAYYKAQNNTSIKSSTFLATLIDFSKPGDISVFIDEPQIVKLEQEMAKKGYLDGKLMASSFNTLRANDLIWSFFIKNYLKGQSPAPFDILYWNADSTNMPATMHSQYLRWMYLQNDLIKPNKIILNNVPLDITKIDIPTFFVSTEKDHIAPWKTTWNGFHSIQGDKRFVLGGSGHIAGIIPGPKSSKYGYYTNDTPCKTADEWFKKATQHKDSWWPEWGKWLKAQSGKRVHAQDVQTLPFKSLMDAPGSYVMAVPSED